MTPPPSTQPPPDSLGRGTNLGRYVIMEVIGHGGMGVVYSAYDTQLDRKLAIKLLRSDLASDAGDEDIASRLLREAQAMARLTHPNVVAVHDVGMHEQGVFLAMEFVDGVTLKEWLRAPRPLRDRLRVLRDAGRGLAAAHAVGLVHRDFKPDNVIVGNDGRVVVLDFGLARVAGDRTPEAALRSKAGGVAGERALDHTGDPLSTPLTLTGTILGTVGYMAPEQVFGEVANALTDQFSYAATLYVALYGEKPFPSKELDRYIDQIHLPVPLPKDSGGVPPWLRRVVLRGLSPDANDRFPSMDAMLEALGADPTLVWKRRAMVVAAVAVLLLGVLGALYATRRKELACVTPPSELRGVWDDAVRSAMTSSFERTGVKDAVVLAGTVAKNIDSFARDWSAMRESACQATRVAKQQPEDVLRLRMDCLDRERTTVKSLTALLVDADQDVVKRAVEIGYGLPETAWCADVPTLRASAGLPDSPEKRAKVLEVRAKLAEVDSLHTAGKSRRSRDVAEAAVVLAREAEHPPTLAEALEREARAEIDLGDHQSSTTRLRESFTLALGSGADAVALRDASHLAFILGVVEQKADDSKLWLETARALLTRIGGSEEQALDLMGTEAAVLDEVYWRPEQALPLQEKVAAGYKRIYGAHPKTATAIYNVGVSLTYLGEHERSRACYEESIAMDLTLGGPGYSEIGATESLLGQALASLGQFDAADMHLHRALALLEANAMDYWATLALQELTSLELLRGDTAAAVRYGESARARFKAVGSPADLVPYVNVPLGDALLRAGRPAEAHELCAAAVSEQAKSAGGIEPGKAYAWDALRCEAEADVALGHGTAAVPLLERSLTMKRRMFPGDYARAEFALARVLGSDEKAVARAVVLATQARDEFARSPFLERERAEVDAWLKRQAARQSRTH